MQGYLNMTKAAEFAGVSRMTLYRWLENDPLPTTQKVDGGVRLVKISDLVEWIERKPGRPGTRRKM